MPTLALARMAYHHRWWLLALFAALFLVAALYGHGAARGLAAGGLRAPHSESARAERILEDTFGLGDPDVVITYSHPSATVRDPAFASQLRPVLDRLRDAPEVERVSSPYPPESNALVSKDGRIAVLSLKLSARGPAKDEAFRRIEPLLQAPELSTLVGGSVPGTLQAHERAAHDLARGELITLPLVALLLVIFFRSPLLAVLPLLVGGFAAVAALACLRLLAQVTEVSTFA